MKAAFGWLGRTGLLYLLLCLAFAFYILAWPRIVPQLGSESLRQDTMSVVQIRETIDREREQLQSALGKREAAIREMGVAVINRRLAQARSQQDEVQREIEDSNGFLDAVRPSRILALQRAKLQEAVLEAEIDALEAARQEKLAGSLIARAEAEFRRYPRIPTANAVRVSFRLCANAETDLEEFERRSMLDQTTREILLRERELLEANRDRRCEAAESRQTLRNAGLAASQQLARARRAYEEAREWSMSALPDTTKGMSETSLREVLVAAAWALLGILLLPYLIRTFFYYVVAPFAQRRRAIRIAVPGTNSVAVKAPQEQSRASIPVRLKAGQELLVRQGFLQSSPAEATLRTRALLDWKAPLASLASGMAMLTRVRGSDTTTVISADDDPFAEVTAIELPEGAAMVLQPRALAAVVQPQERPLRITSHWRLFSLNAWLTQQLRFLVFHGPARLVVKGGRGVRVEPVESGRRFGQDQLAGFSADLSYSVARNETFVPYLLGREPLLRDRVEGGAGVLVLEEAPYAGRRKGLRGGLEGLFDAFLKAFGI
jgi:urease beta subunit